MDTPVNAKKIVVVEDDATVSKFLVDSLNSAGFLALAATDGKEGLALVLQEKPNLIVLDILMPVMDGIEMLKELRKDEWGATAEVLIMTNLTRDDKLAEAFENGVSDYIVKSNWNIDDVVNKIRDILGVI